MAKSTFTADDAALLAELGIKPEANKVTIRTPDEERIIAGFEEIQRFVEHHGRLPSMAMGHDIFERLHATRLEQIRARPECRDALGGLDPHGVLDGAAAAQDHPADGLSDDELLARLDVGVAAGNDVTNLRHVKSRAEKKATEEIANRTRCQDFNTFKPMFEAVQQELATGVRETRTFRKDAGFLKTDIKKGRFFILGGQTAYVAEVGEAIKAPNGDVDARLRVIYSNGTESDILLRSVIRALYKDEASRLISDPSAGPLFSDTKEERDTPSGTIYVLRSKSDDPTIKAYGNIFHKIGVTGQNVETRIANAAHEATFLLAEVDIVATYTLYNINRTKLEKLIHKFFHPARPEFQIKDRFGQPVAPREWFLVPLPAINEAVEKIKEGTIGQYRYDPNKAQLVKR